MPVFCNPIYIVKSKQNCTTLESMHCIEHYGVVNVDAVVLVCINQIHHHIANIEFPNRHASIGSQMYRRAPAGRSLAYKMCDVEGNSVRPQAVFS